MASGGHPYTLVGFTEEVDRRPLFFVEPLPATQVCSACGLVARVMASLPCGHFFCKPCFEQSERSGRVACPLDGDTSSAEEVAWIKSPARSMLDKQVLCWNEANGCNVVTTAADISKHFHRGCGHHLARCPKCGAGILATEVCAHLESHCDTSRVSTAAAVQPRQCVSQEQALTMTCSENSNGSAQRISNTNSMAMSSIQAELREINDALRIGVAAAPDDGETGERNSETRLLQESLSQMRSQMAQLKDQLDEFMHNVNTNQQTFHNCFVEKNEGLTRAVQSRMDQRELAVQFTEFREAMGNRLQEAKAELDRLSQTIDSRCDRMSLLRHINAGAERRTQNSLGGAEAHTEDLAQNALKIAWMRSGLAEDPRDVLARFPSVMTVATTHTWTVGEYWTLKECAMYSDAVATTNPVYLRGYCVSAGIELGRNDFESDGNGCVRFYIRLNKGKIDQFLEWPFNLKMKFTVLHPRGYKRLEYRGTPRNARYASDFLRPVDDHNGFAPVCYIRHGQAQLETCLQDGKIFLGLTLEPQDDEAA